MSDNLELCNCPHNQLTNFDNYFYCVQCGTYQPKDGNTAIKSKRNRAPAFTDPLKLLKIQMEKGYKYRIENAAYLCQRRNLITSMIGWAEKLTLSTGTLFVAVQQLDEFHSRCDDAHYQLYAAAALMLAAKTVELDERIPFISKLKRHTYLPYTTSEIRRAEHQLIKTLGWNLQKTTLHDWVEAVLSIGCVFDSDELDRTALVERINNFQVPKQHGEKAVVTAPTSVLRNVSSFRLTELFERIDRTTKQVCLQVLHEPALLQTDPEMLCLSVIAHIRKTVGLKEALPKQFKEIWPNTTCVELNDLLPPLPIKRASIQEYSTLQFRHLH